MSSWFDTRVRNRREHTPFATISLLKFIRNALMNMPMDEKPYDHQFILTVTNRPDVASRMWVEIQWTDANGKRTGAASQDFDLALWRAVETEMEAQEKAENIDPRERLVKLIESYQEQLQAYDQYQESKSR